VKHVQSANTRKHIRLCQLQINRARKMASTYSLQTCKHTRLCQLQINPARKISRTYRLRTRTRDSVSLRSSHQGNVKHVLPANAHTRDSVSLRSTHQGMSSTYFLRMRKHMRLSQPQINPAWKMSRTYSLRTRKHIRLCQLQSNPVIIKHIHPANTPIA